MYQEKEMIALRIPDVSADDASYGPNWRFPPDVG